MGATTSKDVVRTWKAADVAHMSLELGHAFKKYELSHVIEGNGIDGPVLLQLSGEILE